MLAGNHTLVLLDETKSAERTEKGVGEFVVGLAMQLEFGLREGAKNETGSRGSGLAPIIMTSNLTLGNLQRWRGGKSTTRCTAA